MANYFGGWTLWVNKTSQRLLVAESENKVFGNTVSIYFVSYLGALNRSECKSPVKFSSWSLCLSQKFFRTFSNEETSLTCPSQICHEFTRSSHQKVKDMRHQKISSEQQRTRTEWIYLASSWMIRPHLIRYWHHVMWTRRNRFHPTVRCFDRCIWEQGWVCHSWSPHVIFHKWWWTNRRRCRGWSEHMGLYTELES